MEQFDVKSFVYKYLKIMYFIVIYFRSKIDHAIPEEGTSGTQHLVPRQGGKEAGVTASLQLKNILLQRLL